MTKRKPEPDWVTLLAAILEDRPHLPGVLCIGRHELYDAALHPEGRTDNTTALVAAERLCQHCPHTTACPDSLATRKATA